MNTSDYLALCAFLRARSGIILGENKGYLVESRLSSLAREHGFLDVDALIAKLSVLPATLQDAIVDAMTTNESFFFRDNTPFKLFEEVMMPALTAARGHTGRLKIWCAAASTGQEPYSLAMMIKSNKRLLAGMDVEIIATDLSTTALARAKEGRYSQFEVQRGLPVTMLVEHFTQDGLNWVISDDIKKMVRFRSLNLVKPLDIMGQVDIVFCRNVLIYFDVETKKKVVEAIHRVLRPDGYLVLGSAETLMGVTDAMVRSADKRGLFQPYAAQHAAQLTA